MASQLSENDVLIILGLGFFLMWNAKKKATAAASVKTASYPGQTPTTIPAAQQAAGANVITALGGAFAQMIGTGGAVASANIVTNGLSIPSPLSSNAGYISNVDTTSDGAVLNPSGNVSPGDYLDSMN